MPRVCFYSQWAYPLVDPTSPTIFGGAEVRSWTFARALANRPGFDVTLIVRDDGQPRVQTVDGVTIRVDRPRDFEPRGIFVAAYRGFLEACESRPSFPYFRVKSWRAGLLWQIPLLIFHRLVVTTWKRRRWFRLPSADFYAGIDADVFCIFHMNDMSMEVIESCRRHGRKSVAFLIHDYEVTPGSPFWPLASTTPLVVRALSQVDRIVAQTQSQADAAARNLGRQATIIPNPIDLTQSARERERGSYVLWIGRAQYAGEAHKRPELLFELARKCPEIAFRAIMNNDNPERFAELQRERPENVEIVERVPYGAIDDTFRRARVFVSTSATEGFPNTFLQAGKHSLPIVSLAVDPQGMLTEHGAGAVCSDNLDAMAAELRTVWNDSAHAEKMGRAARRYVERFHDLQMSVDRLAQVIRELCDSETVPLAARPPVRPAP